VKDLDSNDPETAGALERHRTEGLYDDRPDPSEYEEYDKCARCGADLLPNEGYLCPDCKDS
jgi:hypothetical protein